MKEVYEDTSFSDFLFKKEDIPLLFDLKMSFYFRIVTMHTWDFPRWINKDFEF